MVFYNAELSVTRRYYQIRCRCSGHGAQPVLATLSDLRSVQQGTTQITIDHAV